MKNAGIWMDSGKTYLMLLEDGKKRLIALVSGINGKRLNHSKTNISLNTLKVNATKTENKLSNVNLMVKKVVIALLKPLYTYNRYKDSIMQYKNNDNPTSVPNQGWVVTNTRFTIDAINYGKCSGL